MSRWQFGVVILVCCALFIAQPVFGQSTNATISGRIADPSGGSVPAAKISAENVNTGVSYSTETNDAGFYEVGVPPGKYRVIVWKEGFARVVKPDVELHVQDQVGLNFGLQVGSVQQSVTVEGGAPMVNTQDATVSTVVDRHFVENMPLNGRTFQSLIALSPGVVLTPSTLNEPGQFSVNGQRSDSNYFSIDGVSANFSSNLSGSLSQTAAGSLPGMSIIGSTTGLVSIDAMREFRVLTSTFAPEYGRTPGAQVSAVTRSGTNTFHGTAFEYLRNDVLDAKDWFTGHNNLAKPKERQNDFGGVFGGPILRNRTFFFFSYEGLRLRQPNTRVTTVPNLTTRQDAPAVLQPFVNAFPLPNGPDLGSGFAQFAAGYSNPTSIDSTSLRIDHSVSSRITLFTRADYAPSGGDVRGSSSATQQLTANSHQRLNTRTLTVGSTQTLNAHLVNDARFGYGLQTERLVNVMDSFGGSVPLPASSYTPTGMDPAQTSLTFQITGAGNYAVGRNSANQDMQFNVVDNLSWSLRSHQLKFGVDYRDLRPLIRRGTYGTGVVFPSVTELLANRASSVSIAANQPVTLLVKNFSAYAQDAWKASSRLTVTYGLRWDVNPAPSAEGPVPVQALQKVDSTATISLAPRGAPLYDTRYNNIAPRVGVAYQIASRDGWQTVLRGGVGTFYDLGIGITGGAASVYPFTSTLTYSNVAFPLSAAQSVPPPFGVVPLPVGSTVLGADPHLKAPKTYQWNVSFEQGLGAAQSLTLSYVGAAGRDLLSNVTFSSPNPSLNGVFVSLTRSDAASSYNALQLQIQRRLSHGLQARGAYTWSHSLDDASTDLTGGLPANFASLNINRGNSSFDIRHSVNAALSYDLPYPHAAMLAKPILEQWSLDSYVLVRSAPPVDIIGVTTVTNGFAFTSRPNIVPGVPFYLYDSSFAGGKRLNQAAFIAAPVPTQGNLGRNFLRAFGASQVNFAIRREFTVREHASLQFRADFFNLFNHPNFGLPTTLLASPLFGQATQTLGQNLGGLSGLYQIGGPRSIQFALRLNF